jgi:hypothetical protein
MRSTSSRLAVCGAGCVPSVGGHATNLNTDGINVAEMERENAEKVPRVDRSEGVRPLAGAVVGAVPHVHDRGALAEG